MFSLIFKILFLFPQLLLFKEEHEDSLSTATRAINQAIEGTKNNIAWMDNNYEVIEQWLIDHGYGKKSKLARFARRRTTATRR